MRYTKWFCFLAVIMFVSPPAQAATIYWANVNGWPNRIQRVNSDGSNLEDVLLRTSLDGDVAVDSLGGKVYWPENNVIWRANLDGTGAETFYTDTGNVKRIELDLTSNKLYWTSFINTAGIQRVNLDGSGVEQVVSPDDFAENHADGLAIDPVGGKVYWGGMNYIQRANLDGTGVATVFNAWAQIGPSNTALSGNGVEGIALDAGSGKIYWGEWGSIGDHQLIRRADLNGDVLVTGMETILTFADDGVRGPYDIALDLAAGELFWSNKGANWISKSNFDGSNVQTVTSLTGIPAGIDLGIVPEPSTLTLATVALLWLLWLFGSVSFWGPARWFFCF